MRLGPALALLASLVLFAANVLLARAAGPRRGALASSLVFVYEAAKLAVACVWAAVAVGPRSLSWPAWRFAVPAALYVAINNLLLAEVAEIGPLNTVLLGQLKLPATVAFSAMLLGRRVGRRQVAALGLLGAGSLLAQYSPASAASQVMSWLGLWLGVTHSLLSAMSGVYTELVLKRGAASEHMASQQVQLYAWGTVVNALLVWLHGGFSLPSPWTAFDSALVASQVSTGLLMGWLMRYQNNVVKMFLLALTAANVAVAQWFIWGDALELHQALGMGVIFLSIGLYVRATDERESPAHRTTPLELSASLSALAQRRVWLKRDDLQPSGSFKYRGVYRLMRGAYDSGCRSFVSSSGGNAGLAAATAGARLDGATVTVVVPSTTPAFMRERIAAAGATVRVHGSVWADADAHARELCGPRVCYVHPFEGEELWLGHATLVHELPTQPACVVCAVGGGGLLTGIARGLSARGWAAGTALVAVETRGADCLAQSLAAGAPVSLARIDSIAKSLGASRPSDGALELRRSHQLHSRVVSDAQAVAACVALQRELGVLVEPACGAALAVVQSPEWLDGVVPRGVDVVVVVCGGSVITPELLLEHHATLSATGTL